MKKLLLYFCFGLFSFHFQAQEIPVAIQKSNVFEDRYKQTTIVLSEKDKDGNLIVAREYKAGGISQGKGFYIEVYDPNLKLLREFEYPINFSTSEKTPLLIGVVKLNDKLNIIHLFYDLKKKAYSGLSHIINTETFQAEKKTLFELPRDEVMQLGSFALGNIFNDNEASNINKNRFIRGRFFTFAQAILGFPSTSEKSSENKGGSAVAFVSNKEKTSFCIALDLNGSKQEALQVYVFDSQCIKQFDTLLIKVKEETKFTFQSIELSDDGKAVYLASKSVSIQDKEKDKGGKYQFEITKLTKDGNITQLLETESHFIESLKIIAIQDQLVCLGFYSDINENRFKGVAFYSLKASNLNRTETKFSPFSDQFLTDKYGEAKDNELWNLSFRNYLITPSKSIIFNAEEVQEVLSENRAVMPIQGTYEIDNIFFYYYDIVSIKISPNGNLVWARNINKKQSTKKDEDAYVSFSSFLKGEETYFFINAAEKVKKLSNNRVAFGDTRKNKYNLNVLRISESGEFTYQEILDDEQNEVPFMVANGVFSDLSVFFLGRKGRNKQLLKITL